MKNKLAILALSILMVGTTACSQSKQVTVCNYSSEEDVVDTKATLTHDEDELMELVLSVTINLKLGNYDATVEEKAVKEEQDSYKKTKHIDYDYKFNKDSYTKSITADVSKMSKEDFSVLSFPEDVNKKDHFSTEEVKSHLESLSFTCKED